MLLRFLTTRCDNSVPVSSLRRVAVFLLGVALLQACAAPPVNVAHGLKIEGLVIENQTEMWVSAARLLVPVTGAFVSCGNISPGTRCSTTFPETDYSGNPVEFTWSQAGRIHSTGEFVMQIPDDVDLDRPAAVMVVIAAPGSAGATIVQDPSAEP